MSVGCNHYFLFVCTAILRAFKANGWSRFWQLAPKQVIRQNPRFFLFAQIERFHRISVFIKPQARPLRSARAFLVAIHPWWTGAGHSHCAGQRNLLIKFRRIVIMFNKWCRVIPIYNGDIPIYNKVVELSCRVSSLSSVGKLKYQTAFLQ